MTCSSLEFSVAQWLERPTIVWTSGCGFDSHLRIFVLSSSLHTYHSILLLFCLRIMLNTFQAKLNMKNL